MIRARVLVAFGLVFIICATAQADEQLIDAESFADHGGWVVDQQSMDQMGSPYLMAHGLGVKVRDAKTTIRIRSVGTHHHK
jgi:hypothetical protein